jgi:hypothetical protein
MSGTCFLKKGRGGVSKIYLVDPNDLVFSDDGTTALRFKRKYGKFKRQTFLLTRSRDKLKRDNERLNRK